MQSREQRHQRLLDRCREPTRRKMLVQFALGLPRRHPLTRPKPRRLRRLVVLHPVLPLSQRFALLTTEAPLPPPLALGSPRQMALATRNNLQLRRLPPNPALVQAAFVRLLSNPERTRAQLCELRRRKLRLLLPLPLLLRGLLKVSRLPLRASKPLLHKVLDLCTLTVRKAKQASFSLGTIMTSCGGSAVPKSIPETGVDSDSGRTFPRHTWFFYCFHPLPIGEYHLLLVFKTRSVR